MLYYSLHSALQITDFRYYLSNPRGPYIELALLGELEKKTDGNANPFLTRVYLIIIKSC